MGNMVEKIRKRDGRIVEFNKSEIANAVFKAFFATKSKDGKTADYIANQVVKIVEEVLIKNGYTAVATGHMASHVPQEEQ